MQLIPAVDLLGEDAVRLERGDYDRVLFRHPVEEFLARVVATSPSMIHLVDLDGARHGAPRVDLVRRCVGWAGSVPLQVSGGLRRVEDARDVLGAGATRVIVGTAAWSSPAALAGFVDAFRRATRGRPGRARRPGRGQRVERDDGDQRGRGPDALRRRGRPSAARDRDQPRRNARRTRPRPLRPRVRRRHPGRRRGRRARRRTSTRSSRWAARPRSWVSRTSSASASPSDRDHGPTSRTWVDLVTKSPTSPTGRAGRLMKTANERTL